MAAEMAGSSGKGSTAWGTGAGGVAGAATACSDGAGGALPRSTRKECKGTGAVCGVACHKASPPAHKPSHTASAMAMAVREVRGVAAVAGGAALAAVKGEEDSVFVCMNGMGRGMAPTRVVMVVVVALVG